MSRLERAADRGRLCSGHVNQNVSHRRVLPYSFFSLVFPLLEMAGDIRWRLPSPSSICRPAAVVPVGCEDPGRPDAGDRSGGTEEPRAVFATRSVLPDVYLRTDGVNGTMEIVRGRTPSESHGKEAHLLEALRSATSSPELHEIDRIEPGRDKRIVGAGTTTAQCKTAQIHYVATSVLTLVDRPAHPTSHAALHAGQSPVLANGVREPGHTLAAVTRSRTSA
jgi:hypothetical protein